MSRGRLSKRLLPGENGVYSLLKFIQTGKEGVLEEAVPVREGYMQGTSCKAYFKAQHFGKQV